MLEGATAYFAALRADAGDIARIRALLWELERTRAEDDKAAEADADARLHDAIAQASHNTMFLHLHTSVIGMLREHITINGTGLREQDAAASGQLLLQHRTLCEAICARRPEERARPCRPISISCAATSSGTAAEARRPFRRGRCERNWSNRWRRAAYAPRARRPMPPQTSSTAASSRFR